MQLKIGDCRDDENITDDHAALENVVDHINQLAPLAKPKDHVEEAKIRFFANMCEERTVVCGKHPAM